MKKLFIFLTLVVIGGISFAFFSFKDRPVLTYPYPYQFKSSPSAPQEIKQANLLFLGSDLEKQIDLDRLTAPLNQKLTTPLKAISWTQAHESIFRSLHKLKSLEKVPPVIIFSLGQGQMLENVLPPENLLAFQQNLKMYQDPTWGSLILILPYLSKFLYRTSYQVSLSDKAQSFDFNWSDLWEQKRQEYFYLLFEDLLEEMIEVIEDQGSKIILVNSPIYLENPPSKSCSNSQSDRLEQVIRQAEEKLTANDFKSALSLLEKSDFLGLGNAYYFYLKGLSEKKLGRFQDSRLSLEKALAFDCRPKNSPILNRIMTKLANKKALPLIDFHQIVHQNFGKKALFIQTDKPLPDPLPNFYQALEELLRLKIAKALEL